MAYYTSSKTTTLNIGDENALYSNSLLCDGQDVHNVTKIPSDNDKNDAKRVSSPSSGDYSTLKDLQDFIDQSFNNVMLQNNINISSAQIVDSSTPFRLRGYSNSAAVEELQFTAFRKSRIESCSYNS